MFRQHTRLTGVLPVCNQKTQGVLTYIQVMPALRLFSLSLGS
ncbi:hypothetical protein AB4Z30_19180 [Paenibacillus sp. 2TAF8]